MKVMVTGGAGFIGSHVAETLLDSGYSVVILDNLSTGHRRNIPSGADFVEMDIRDPGLGGLIAELKPDIISHHAAQMSVRISLLEPRLDADVNVEGTINLLEAARDAGVRKIIYASTGGALYGEPRYLPCDEEHPVHPLSHYGISKHTVEHYLELYHGLYGLDFTVLRYPNVYGPRQDPDSEAGVVAIFAGKMLRGEPVTIFGDGKQERDFVHVADVARANLLACTRGSASIVNLGSGEGTSVMTIFQELAQATGYDRLPEFGAARPGEVYRIYLTGDRAMNALGWTRAIPLGSGLRDTLATFATPEIAA